MNWDHKEFRELCKNKKLPDSYSYQESLFWKRARAVYHSEKSEEMWNEWWKVKEPIKIFGQKWTEREVAMGAEIEACAQVLNSIPEDMAHIINISLFRGLNPSKALPDENVYIHTINDKIHQLPFNPNNIKKEIGVLIGSDEFQYIRAFINEIKHYKLIKADWFVEASSDPKEIKKGWKYSGFSHKDDTFDEKYHTYIVDDCVKLFLGQIVKIGVELNNYLKQIK